MRIFAWAALLLLLAGCSPPMDRQGFAGSGAFNPLVFFTGHVTSWGVEENRDGQPTTIVTTDCTGTPQPGGGLKMVQILHVGSTSQTRVWVLRQTSPDHFSATANDMDGTAQGEVAGRAMHWRWVLETAPGAPLKNVTMDQWFYQMADGAVMVRTNVSKAGIRLLQVSEQFEKQP